MVGFEIQLVALGLFILFGVIVIIVIITVMRSDRLIIRDPMNRSRYINQFMVTEKKDKHTGVLLWKSVFWQPKIQTPKPPPKAIEVGKRGKKYAEAYRLSEDEYIWITDAGIRVKEIIKDGRKTLEVLDVVKDGKLKTIDTFKPFTVTQRDVLVSQFKKAKEISGGGWTTERVLTVASVGGLVLIVIMLMIFWGDIAKPALDSHELALDVQRQNIQLQNNIVRIAQSLGTNVQGFQTIQTAEQQGGSGITQSSEEPPNE